MFYYFTLSFLGDSSNKLISLTTQFNKLMDAYRESQNAVERTMDKKLTVIGRMHKQRKEAMERLATLKLLGLKSGLTMNNIVMFINVIVTKLQITHSVI